MPNGALTHRSHINTAVEHSCNGEPWTDCVKGAFESSSITPDNLSLWFTPAKESKYSAGEAKMKSLSLSLFGTISSKVNKTKYYGAKRCQTLPKFYSVADIWADQLTIGISFYEWPPTTTTRTPDLLVTICYFIQCWRLQGASVPELSSESQPL